MLGQEGGQEFQLNKQNLDEQVKKANDKRKKEGETKKLKKAPTAEIEVLKNLNETLAQETREQLKQFSPKDEIPFEQKVLEGQNEWEDRPYSREELLALEQTRGFSSIPNHPLSMPGATQVGTVDVLLS